MLKQDKSVGAGAPADRQEPDRSSTGSGQANLLARFHALWTLEGLGALDAATVRAQMKDANPRMRIQAIRASETLYKAGDRSFDADYRAAAVDKDMNVAIQAMLTLNYLKAPNVAETVRAAQAASTARGVQEIGNQILKPAASAFGRGGRGGPPPFSPAELAVMERGEAIYKEVCFACHGDDGRGTSLAGGPAGATMAPSLASSTRVQGHRDYVTKTLLHGMDGPIEGKTYAGGVMAPMGTNRDEWIAAIGSYVRNSFGNVGSFVSTADVARVRADTASRKTFWKVDELMASLPTPLDVLSRPGRQARAIIPGRRSARSTSRRGRLARRSNRACGSRSSCRSQPSSPRSSSTRRKRVSGAAEDGAEGPQAHRRRQAGAPP